MNDLIEFFTLNTELFLVTVAVFSLFIGSFLNVVIYRLPIMLERSWNEECRVYLGLKGHTELEKLSLTLPFSHCPQCKKVISPWHNIPIVSYIFLKGRCAYCQARISVRYPLVEAITTLMSVYVAWRFGLSLETLAGLLFTWILICLTFIDNDYHLLPDELTYSLLWLGLFFSLFNLFVSPSQAIIGAMAGYGVFAVTKWLFEKVTGRVGMGQGDVKLLAALGAYLGWQMLPLIILMASISGVIFAVTQMTIKRKFISVPLPFGPYLALAGWIALLWGQNMMQAYMELMI